MKISATVRAFVYLVIGVGLLAGVGALVKWLAPEMTQMVGADVARLFDRPYFHLGRQPITAIFLLKALLYLTVLTLVTRVLRRFLRQSVLVRTSMDPGQQYALARIAGYVVFVLGAIIGLQSAGLDLSSLVVVGGALGIGVGFGLQTIVSNFVSGLVLLVERPIKLGDRVEVGDTYGDVVRIAGRSTWIRTNDNVVIIVPNSEFIEKRVTNWTANDRRVRFSLSLGVSYGSQPEQVRDILLGVARAHPSVLFTPPPEVLFTEFGDSSLNFSLRVWTDQVEAPKRLVSDLYFGIFKAFREQGIEIPFPQRDLHLKSSAIPLISGNE
jgi:small-conductance mechanosensitive channel